MSTDLSLGTGPGTPVDQAEAATPLRPKRGRLGGRVWRVVSRVGVLLSIAWLLVVIIGAVFAPVLPIQDPNATDPCSGLAAQLYQGVPRSSLPASTACPDPTFDSRPGAHPSGLHTLGLDESGRDVLARLVWGGRVSMTVGFVAVGIGSAVGALIALFAAYLGGWFERTASAITDAMLSFPAILVVICVVAFRGQSLSAVSFGVAFACVPAMYRIARVGVLSMKVRDHILMDRILGIRPLRTIWVGIALNIAPAVITYFLVLAAGGIVIEGGLAFLGLSVPQPTSSWGSMISGGEDLLQTSPLVSLIPSAALVATVAAIGCLAEFLRKRQAIRGSAL
ncbi:MAG TPA: ABC transporter permease [Pseudonocardiaceae bacterium]|nr:ABC transporter permease [Pseudonocardiaceae bacterium]